MNKFITKLAKLTLGLAMAAGASVAVSAGKKGASPVHAADQTVSTSTFSRSSLGSAGGTTTLSTGSFSWSVTRTIKSGSGYTATGVTSGYCQFGSKNNVEDMTITTSAIPGTIKSVSVDCAAYSGNHNVSITVDGTSYYSGACPTWSNNSGGTRSGTGTSSGTIIITFTSKSSARAAYLKSISVTYNNDVTSYTVTYNNNGGSGSMSNTTGTSVSAATCTFTAPSHKHFVEWNESSTGNGTSYAEGATVNKTVTLYAIWAWDTFTVTYNSHGGSGTMTDSNSPYNYNSSVTVQSCSFTPPSGKAFDHWDTKEDDSGIDYDPTDSFSITANTTLYAQWVNGYTVSMSVSGYTLTGTKSGKAGAEIDDLVLVANAKHNLPDSISIAGFSDGTDYDYDSSDGTILIYNLKADAVISFSAVEADRELCVSGQTTEFNKGTDFSSSGIRVYWLYDDSSLTEEDISAGGETGYSINSSAYNKNKLGTYKIIVSCDGETVEYSVKVVNAPTIDYIDDTLTPSNISNPSTYSAWSGKSKTITGIDSDSIYDGYSTGGTTYIQMRASDSGIYTSTSGGKINKVTVVWNSSTIADRQLKIYGSDSAFTSISSIEESGTYVGQIDHNTSQTEYTFSADYTYVGIRPYGGATYFDSITFQWAVEGAPADPAVSITSTFTALKYAGESDTVTAEFINETGDEGSILFESTNTEVATITSGGVVTAVAKGETTINVTDSEGVASPASFTLRVVSAHKGDRQSDPLTTTEAIDIYKLDSDHSLEYYVSGTVKEIDTESYDDPDYYIDKTSSEEDPFDFFAPTFGDNIAKAAVTVDRQVIAFGSIKEWRSSSTDELLGVYGMSEPEIVYVSIGELQSISLSGTMSVTSYSSKDSTWDMSGISVNATYAGEANVIDIAESVNWTYNYSSPSAVNLTCEKGQKENASLTGTASFGGKTASFTSAVTVTIQNDGYFIHTTTSGWEKTNLSDLTADDTFVIVGVYNESPYAMSNDNGTSSAPSAVSVTIANNQITSTVAPNLQWNVSGNASDGYVFTPNGSNSSYLYNTSTNNGVRVGTPDNAANKVYTVSNDGYLYNANNQRYIGVYNGSDWRSYGNTTGNIANETFEFYKKSGVYEVGDDLIGAVNSFEGEYSWSAQCTSFESSDWASGGSSFTSSIKSDYHLNQIVANINGNKIEAFLAKYDVVIGKFGTTHDFLGRFSEGGINYGSARIVPMINIVGSTNTVAILVIISMVSVTAIGGYFFLRKRREQN